MRAPRNAVRPACQGCLRSDPVGGNCRAANARLQLFRRARDLVDLGIDSKLRAWDLVRLKVRDICHGDRVAATYVTNLLNVRFTPQ
jgi:hypothetical protein